MSSLLRSAAFVLMGAGSLPAFAESCYVTTEPAMAGPSGAHTQLCYEHQGMDAGSLDWSCNNSTKDVQKTHKEKRGSCPTGYFGSCTAALTQEALGNQASSGRKGEPTTAPQIPEGATLVTHYYQVQDKGQARVDCENGGGQWSTP
ncbi:hypothetical protein [Pseudomonas sp. RIT-PI-AD]|uniref:hypothetical protein n=1 Tax=Pseudomonas sp. RIT-PI-AD TaxID=3035294 RepID=UPI0021DAB60B|nr:hypothetical protein [Pseudomonas sp. RIT-PI-AD]